MPSENDYPARGRIKQVDGSKVIFLPSNTNYELHLATAEPYAGPVDSPVEGFIRVTARKVWTVPSGGNFTAPIFGEPRTIQGRVKWLDEKTLVVQAGTNFVVEMPASDRAIDLANGDIECGVMVNVTALPGARFEASVPAKA
jgi:hypothetical protein